MLKEESRWGAKVTLVAGGIFTMKSMKGVKHGLCCF